MKYQHNVFCILEYGFHKSTISLISTTQVLKAKFQEIFCMKNNYRLLFHPLKSIYTFISLIYHNDTVGNNIKN